MNLKEQLNSRDNWREEETEFDEFVIHHNELPIEIVVENGYEGPSLKMDDNGEPVEPPEFSERDEKDRVWEAWLHVKKDSFEKEIPAMLFDKAFDYKKDAKVFAREMAYKNGIERRLENQ